MERRFDMSDFEQSLKDHADQFKMTPSKRVWNGIYNNLHPGSRWPSITVGVVFLITLVTIGTLNNTTKHSDHFIREAPPAIDGSKQAIKERQNGDALAFQNNSGTNSSVTERPQSGKVTGNPTGVKGAGTPVTQMSAALTVRSGVSASPKHPLDPNNQNKGIAEPTLSEAEGVADAKNSLVLSTSIATPSGQKSQSSISNVNAPVSLRPLVTSEAEQPAETFSKDLSVPVSYKVISLQPSAPLAGRLICLNLIDPVNPEQSSAVNATMAAGVNKLRKKKNERIEWTFYVNPTISTVFFNKKTVQPADNASSLVVLSNQPSFKLIHNSRFGMETGAEMSLRFAKKFQLITGLNVHYSGYNNVSNLVHPTFATLTLNDKKGGTYSKTYITHYGNGQSQDHIDLVNYSIEASIPLGVQYNIWGSQKIRIDVSTLLEPSVVMRDDAYLISSDGRYYVNDPLLVRRINLEGRFGSYITFIGRKIKWHLGPDFRYQLFSTYKNIYPTKEHLADYGIRIGISK